MRLGCSLNCGGKGGSVNGIEPFTGSQFSQSLLDSLTVEVAGAVRLGGPVTKSAEVEASPPAAHLWQPLAECAKSESATKVGPRAMWSRERL